MTTPPTPAPVPVRVDEVQRRGSAPTAVRRIAARATQLVQQAAAKDDRRRDALQRQAALPVGQPQRTIARRVEVVDLLLRFAPLPPVG